VAEMLPAVTTAMLLRSVWAICCSFQMQSWVYAWTGLLSRITSMPSLAFSGVPCLHMTAQAWRLQTETGYELCSATGVQLEKVEACHPYRPDR
jgi:hypothetical protein